MKQIVQNLKSGVTELVDIPCPQNRPDHYLIQTYSSLISVGTERMLLDFGKAGFLQKAQQQPDKVRMVFDKCRTDGLLPTIDAIRSKLDQPLTMGYCNVGRVVDVERNEQKIFGFKIGDRVVSNGPHAEMVCVANNLCVKIPENVSDESASFTVIGAIGLQGIRLAKPTLGESFVVTGLGLVGLMTVQLLLAHGCRVLGIDFDTRKCELARNFGAAVVDLSKNEDPVSIARDFSRRRGVDGVLICASTKSSDPVHQAANMCRKRGRIVLVGVVGLKLSRADFFEKELTFQVSCSYGPGRYEHIYEAKGYDYPFAFVRWTEQRNFEAVLDMMVDGRLDVEPLISHRFAFKQAVDAYKVLYENQSSLGIILQYNKKEKVEEGLVQNRTVSLKNIQKQLSLRQNESIIGFIGAGNYASRILIPAFKKTGAVFEMISSQAGVSGNHVGRKYDFNKTTTDNSTLIQNQKINTIVIATRHNSHARFTCEALEAGKHVFVEKPLCLTLNELTRIEEICAAKLASNIPVPLLMIGFNRRFAPQIQKLKSLLSDVVEPKSFIMTVNAGFLSTDHWINDLEVGGGRIIGEACHYIDLLRFLAGVKIISSSIVKMEDEMENTVSIQLAFMDGSVGSVHYFANGSKKYSKERLEVFTAGRIVQLDNFRKMTGYDWPGIKKMNLWRQDKGQNACVSAFVNAIRNGRTSPIPLEEIFEVTRVTIELAQKVLVL